jgi:hypothetical protein
MTRWTFAGLLAAMVIATFEALFRVVCRADSWGPVR